MKSYVLLPSLSALPTRDYREVAYFAGDVRDLALRIGTAAIEGRNDRGAYLSIPMVLEGVPLQFIGLMPFLTVEFAVVADPGEAGVAARGAAKLLEQLGLIDGAAG